MSEIMRTIEIDFDVHKAIEAERQSFSEVPNAVLRRLLKLGPGASVMPTANGIGGAWTGKGVTLTKLTKAPDLCFKLRNDEEEPRPVLSVHEALFVECKPIDKSHSAGGRYCDDGLCRLVCRLGTDRRARAHVRTTLRPVGYEQEFDDCDPGLARLARPPACRHAR